MYQIHVAYYVNNSHIKEFIEWLSTTEYKDYYWAYFNLEEMSISDVVDDFDEFYKNNYAIISIETDNGKNYINYEDNDDNWLDVMQLSCDTINKISYWDKTILRKIKLKQLINI